MIQQSGETKHLYIAMYREHFIEIRNTVAVIL